MLRCERVRSCGNVGGQRGREVGLFPVGGLQSAGALRAGGLPAPHPALPRTPPHPCPFAPGTGGVGVPGGVAAVGPRGAREEEVRHRGRRRPIQPRAPWRGGGAARRNNVEE